MKIKRFTKKQEFDDIWWKNKNAELKRRLNEIKREFKRQGQKK